MDDVFNQLMAWISHVTGLSPAVVALFIPVFVAVFNIIGRLIPDDATGFAGALRKMSKFLGLYLSNRVTTGVSVNDVSKAVVASPQTEISEQGELILTQDMTSQAERDARGRFLPKDRMNGFVGVNVLLGLFALAVIAVFTSGCAVMNRANDYICKNQVAVRASANEALVAADSISDAKKRLAAKIAAQALITALDECPPGKAATANLNGVY